MAIKIPETIKISANIALSNLANVAVNTDILPDTDSLRSLGSSTLAWANLYLDNLTTADGRNLVIDPALDTIIKGSTSDSTTAALDVQNLDGTSLLYVRNDGNVGIGTTGPGYLLQVGGAGSKGIVIQGGVSTAGSAFLAGGYATFGELRGSGTVFGDNVVPSTTVSSQMNILNTHSSVGARAIFIKDEVGIAFHTLDGSVTAGNAFSSERMRIDESGNVGIGTTAPTISGTGKLHMAANTMRLDTARTITNSTDTGNVGEICWDANFLYICVGTNSWKRVALSTW